MMKNEHMCFEEKVLEMVMCSLDHTEVFLISGRVIVKECGQTISRSHRVISSVILSWIRSHDSALVIVIISRSI